MDHKECVLIDVPPEPMKLLAEIIATGLRPVAIFATHGHVDHIGGITGLIEGLSLSSEQELPVHIHSKDRHMLEDPIGTSGALGDLLEASGLPIQAPEVIKDLADNQIIKGASMVFRALHTPGHTRGSTCLSLEVDGEPPMLFSGDHLFRGSIGRTDLEGGSFDILMDSMKRKILPLIPQTVVLPGHGPATTLAYERQTNPFIREIL